MLVGHLHMGAVDVGAPDLHGEVAAGIAGFDPDGIVGVIGEFEVRTTPGDGGVHAGGDVMGDIAVGIALHDFHIRPECGQIQRGGGLAHAAAHFIDGLALHIGRCGGIALGGGTLAHGAVVGEDVAAVQHSAVAGGGGQLDVVLPAAGTAHVGGTFTQQVPEQHGLQLFCRDGGIGGLGGHGDGLAGGRLVQKGLGLFQIEGRAGLLRDDRVGGGVKGGVLHVADHGLVDCLGGQHLCGGNGAGEPEVVVLTGGERVTDALFHGGRVHLIAVLAHQNFHGALFQFVSTVHCGQGQALGQLRRRFVEMRGDQNTVQLVSQNGGFQEPESSGEETAAVAVVPGPLGAVLAVQENAAQIGKGQLFLGRSKAGDILFLVGGISNQNFNGGVCGLLIIEKLFRLGLGHAAHFGVDVLHLHGKAGEEGVDVGCIGAEAQISDHQNGDEQNHHHFGGAEPAACRLLLGGDPLPTPSFGFLCCLFHDGSSCLNTDRRGDPKIIDPILTQIPGKRGYNPATNLLLFCGILWLFYCAAVSGDADGE